MQQASIQGIKQLLASVGGLAPLVRSQSAALPTRCHGLLPCGEYDRRTWRGKRFAGTYGLSRPKPNRIRGGGGGSVMQFRHLQPPSARTPPGLAPYSLESLLEGKKAAARASTGNQANCSGIAAQLSSLSYRVA